MTGSRVREGRVREVKASVGRRSLVAVALLLAFTVAGAASGQFAATDKVIEKPSKEGEGRKLDASGLTNGFEVLVRMTRSIDRAEIGDASVEVNAGRLPLVGVDWDAFSGHEQGLVKFQTAAAIKLRTSADIVVGDLRVPAGNVSPGFAGIYSLWLRLDDGGQWKLVVNSEPDIWGSMHDPAHDIGEARLEHSVREGAKSSLEVKVEPSAGSGPGTISLSWGEHSWQTTVAAAG